MEDRIDNPPAEFSRIVSVARLGDDEAVYEIAANAAERAGLARRFGLVALDRFAASVRLRREAGRAIRLQATISAEIVQECVVTLEAFASRLEEAFELLYRRGAEPAGTLEFGEDDIEYLAGDEIDIGEAAAQQLSLALDPFPRAPGAALPETAAESAETARDGEAGTVVRHPFAELAKLAKK